MPGPTSRAEARRARMAARNAPPSPASAGGWGPSISEFASGYGERAQEVGGALKSLIRSPYDIYRNMQTPEGFKASVEGFKEGAGSAFGGFFSDPLQAAGNVFDPGVQSVVEQAIDPSKARSGATKAGRAGFDLTLAALPIVGKYAKPAVKGAANAVREAEMFAPRVKPKITDFQQTTAMNIPRASEAPTSLRGFSNPPGIPGDTSVASPYRNPGRRPVGIPEQTGPGTPAWSMGPSASSGVPVPPPPNFYGGVPGIPSERFGGVRLGTVEAGRPVPVSAGMGRTSDAQAAFEAMVPERYKGGVAYEPDLQNMEGAIGPVAPRNPRLGTVTERGIRPAPAPPGTKSVAQMVQEYGVEETARRTGMSVKEVKAGRILDKEPKVTVKVAPRNPPPAPQPKPKPSPVVKAPTMEEKLRATLEEVQRNPPPPVETAPSTRVASGARPLAQASDEAVGAQASRGNKSAQRELALREQEAAGTIEQPKPQGPNVTKQNATRDYLQGMVDRGEAMDLSDARTILQRKKEQPRTRNVGTGPLARLRSESGAVGRNIEQKVIDPGDSDFDFLDRPEYNLKDRLQRLLENEEGAIKFKNVKEEDFYEAWRRLQEAQPGEVHSGFAENLLTEHDVDPTRPGLQVANPDDPYYKHVVYRDPKGKPIIVAELTKTRHGDWGISSFGRDPNLKGSPLMGKAMHKTTLHLMDDLGVRGPSTSISGDTRNYITKLVTRGTGKTVEELDAMFPPPPRPQRGQRYSTPRSGAMHPGVSPEMAASFQESIDRQTGRPPIEDTIARLRRQLDAAGLQDITDDQLRQTIAQSRGEGNPIDYDLTPQPSRGRGNLTPEEHERHARVTRLEGELSNAEQNETRRMESRERAIAEGRDPSIYGPPERRERALQRLRAELDEARNPNRFDEPATDRWDVDNPDAPEQNLPNGEQSYDYERWLDDQARASRGEPRKLPDRPIDQVEGAAEGGGPEVGDRLRRLAEDETGAINFNPQVIKKAIGDVGNLADQARMTSMLSGLALPKSLLGNVGAHIAASAEGRTLRPLKALTDFRSIGRDLKTGWQQGHNPTLQAGFGRFNIPGRAMGAADYAATNSLMRSGLSEAAAKELLLTESNPVAKWKPLNTPLGKLLVPFKTTPFNQLGQGLTRGKKHKLVYGGSIAAGAGAGALTDDPETLALASALAGPYALPMLMGASLTAGPRALQGVSPIPEWSITKTLTEPWAPFTESPGARWFENNLGFGKPASETSQTKRTSVRRSNVTR